MKLMDLTTTISAIYSPYLWIFLISPSFNRIEATLLIEFSVENYRSFKDRVTLSLLPAALVSKDKSTDQRNKFEAKDGLELLKSAAIYGANASGKSNLFKAMGFMRTFALASSKETQATDAIGAEPFRLSDETAGKPSGFQIIFLLGGVRFRYGFEVTAEAVTAEWLFQTRGLREARLFTRDGATYSIASAFKEGKGLAPRTRSNALFLSVCAQFNGAVSQKVLGWFRRYNIISGLQDLQYRNYTISTFEKNEYRDEIVRFVRGLDVGIQDIRVDRLPMADALPANLPDELRQLILNAGPGEARAVKTVHQRFDATGAPAALETFDIERNESEGTQKLFYLAGPLIDTLRTGSVLVVDELDARLHPLITCALFNLFNSLESNPKNAQLIFSTHDTNLLDNRRFRRDQVWFAEKDRLGATHLYSLAEYKVRNDASFGDDYVRGKYGAIPFLGDLSKIAGDFSE